MMHPALASLLGALAALSVAGAGCLESRDGGIEEAPPTPDEAEAPEPATQEIAFTLGGGLGTPVVSIVPTDDERLHPFEVAEGHAMLTVTAEWECVNPTLCDLEVHLRRGNQNLVTAAYGASPLTFSVDEPEEGRYTLIAFPDRDGSITVGVEGTFTVGLS